MITKCDPVVLVGFSKGWLNSLPPWLIFPHNTLSLRKLKPCNSPFALPLHFCSERETKKKNHKKKKTVCFFFSAGSDSIYMLLMCSSSHYPAAESAPVCKHRRCVCVWSSLECVAAEQKAGKLLQTAVPVITCQQWQPDLWWWRGLMGVSAALGVSRMLGAWKLDGCPVPGSPGVCLSPLGPCSWHSAVCRIGLLLAGEEKTSFVQHFCVCRRPARKLMKLKWSHMSFCLGKESSKWEHVCSY